jgi:hypothetical protein
LPYTDIVPKTFGRPWARRANLIRHRNDSVFDRAPGRAKACQKPGLSSISRQLVTVDRAIVRDRYWALSEANVMRTLPPFSGNINLGSRKHTPSKRFGGSSLQAAGPSRLNRTCHVTARLHDKSLGDVQKTESRVARHGDYDWLWGSIA